VRSLHYIRLFCCCLGLSLALSTFQPTIAQNPLPLQDLAPSKFLRFELPKPLSPTVDPTTRLATDRVHLDGYELFTIATPAVVREQSEPNTAVPVEARARSIETALKRIIEQTGSRNGTLNVTSTLDPASNLPIITVDGQYLMTVTTLDAQLQGQTPEVYAKELIAIIQPALVQAIQERQPTFLKRQGLIAIAILFAILLTNWSLSRLQRYFQAQKERIQAELPALAPNAQEAASYDTQLRVRQQLQKRQQRDIKDVQKRLLQMGQFALWSGASLMILGLFPYTRELQVFVLSGPPIKVLSIIITTYVLDRGSDILIDHFFRALEAGQFLSPQASHRFALRISTFSRVAKSLATITLMATAVLLILAAIGIQILPLLAGAGIVGIAISLASQNLIKDVINGFLILLEDQYAVGDVIQVDSVSGLVEYMNLRITQLRTAEGRLVTIPNSAITIVENLSKDWSRVDLAIAIAADADVNRVIQVIQAVGDALSQDPLWQNEVVEPPEVLGIDELSSNGVTIRVWIKTQPLQQWKVGREFRKRLKIALDESDIAIAVPQQALSLRRLTERNRADAPSAGRKNAKSAI
jgi:moderate conductance mechanosensitive channel